MRPDLFRNTLLWLGILIVISSIEALGQTFTDSNVELMGVLGGAVAWGDYDNDGDLDILITGEDDPFTVTTKIYRNDGNEIFTDISVNFIGVSLSSVAWGDYDNDGDLDVLMTGQLAPFVAITVIYRNDGNNTFTDTYANLIGAITCSVAWGDYDNDGDLDIVLSGLSASGNTTKVYRNEGDGTFTDIYADLIGVRFSAVAWGDYDNDGDLDILLTGEVNSDQHVSKIYRNDGNGVFTDIDANLMGASHGSVAWGDYDSDGDLDILLTGSHGSYNEYTVSKIYRNDGAEVFIDINADLIDVAGSAAWGDYDNDGDLDILLTGWKNMAGDHTIVYRNDGNGIFVDINDSLVVVGDPSIAWGDYDNDGDLDFLLSGQEYWTGPTTKLYRNDGGFIANAPPSSPAGLNKTARRDSVVLSWHRATDNETPSQGLTYNLRVGTCPYGMDIISPMADPCGYRRIAALGNVNHDTTWTIKDLSDGIYYWSVQAVDNAFAGSVFSLTDSFSIVVTDACQRDNLIPKQYALHQNYPNPFNPVTTIKYELPRSSKAQLTIYNVLGEMITMLVDAQQPAGYYKVNWDGTDITGNPVASGMYFCRLETERFIETKKILLVK